MTSRAAVEATLRAFPRGRSLPEILSHLGLSGQRVASAAVARELHVLAAEGSIVAGPGGRWRAPLELNSQALIDPMVNPGDIVLAGVPATASRAARGKTPPETQDDAARPDPRALVRYYRSALRSDPRGATCEPADRHGVTWQILAMTGSWWPTEGQDATISIRLDALPDRFRQALSRRLAEDSTLALGWPCAVGRRDGVPVVRPAGLLSARWSRDGERLLLHVEAAAIRVNPDWLRAVARSSGWTSGALADHLTGGDPRLDAPEFGRRLREAVASQVQGVLEPSRLLAQLSLGSEGLVDALCMVLPGDSSFTAGAVDDLDGIATWETDTIEGTALGAFLGSRRTQGGQSRPARHPMPLNPEQISAVRHALSAPLSVVTGPPGTGKTQTILAMVSSALLDGESVLVASRNHQALDAVEQRLRSTLGQDAELVRTLDPEEGRDVGFAQALEGIVQGEAGPSPPPTPDRLGDLAARRDDQLDLAEARRRLALRIAERVERLAAGTEGAAAPVARPAAGLLSRLLAALLGARSMPASPLREEAAALDQDRAELRAMPALTGDPVGLTDEVSAETARRLGPAFAAQCCPTEPERAALAEAERDARLGAAGDPVGIEATARRVVARRPVWMASVLGAPRRIPLVPALFDLVIFDEASQCDIAGSLPLLARARRAVIVGDGNQLSMIPGLGVAQDRNLMAAQGLPMRGMGRRAQSLNSLFDAAQAIPEVPRTLLRDQFRSAPAITDYIGEAFYGGRLRVAVDEARLRPVPGLAPGLHWTDVPGTARAHPDGGTSNPAEAAAVADQVHRLLATEGFEGSVGVVTPFNAQVREIEAALAGRLQPGAAERSELRIATVDRFQGQERDLILVSPVLCALSPSSARSFVAKDWRRINVAVSRARSVAHIVGDLSFARAGGVDVLRRLAARATAPVRPPAEGDFDSEWERILFHAMRARGWTPKPQHPVAGRRLDFALFGAKGVQLDVEVDGRRWHQDADGNRKTDDLWRDARLTALGWRVRRFWVDELNRNMEGCLDLIARDLA